MLSPRISRMKERHLNTIPCITAERLVLQTEAYKKFAGDAVPIFRAKVVRYIMERMTTLILDDELIVGTATNAYRGASLHPEFQSSSWYTSDIDEFSTRKKDPYYISPEDKKTILETLPYWEGKSMEDLADQVMPAHIKELEKDDIICVGLENGVCGETTPDHDKIMELGLRGYMDECRRNIDAHLPQTREEQEKVDFWNACIIQCEGLITYAHRMAEEAERKASQCEKSDPERAKELRLIAENCRVVPENPPQTFYQGLQMIWFVHLYFYIEVCTTACGFGRFDQYMWPLYKKDVLEEKNITREQALEMLESFYLKTNEVYEVRDNWYATSFAGYPMWQTLMVGGQTREGKDASNDLSFLCLEAADQLQTRQPIMALRVWEGTPKELFDYGCRMVQEGQANPGFFSDRRGIEIAMAKGGTLEEARDWNIVGCTQPAPGGGGAEGSPDAGYVNMGKMIEFVLHNGVDPATGKLMGLQTGDPEKFKNIEEVKDALKKQILHHYDLIRQGYNLMQSIHMNRYPVIFEGNERLRQLLLNKPAKYGNNNAHVDGVYREMMHFIADNVQQWPDARGGHYAFGIDSQTMNLSHGAVTGALPDGRLAGEPLCDASSPMMGRDVNGPTATVKSVASMVDGDLHEGALYNLRFDPHGVQGEKGLNILEGVIKTYFNDGGQHIQINVVDNETLKKAQIHPENYRGLMVRVAGYMAYFTELDKTAQDAIIYRRPHLAATGNN